MDNLVDSVMVPMQKACRKCKKLFPVEPEEVKWKTVCSECYSDMDHRQCKGCERNLPVDAKKWVRLCANCWKEKRSLTHGTCPLCPEEKKDLLSRKLTDGACTECTKELAAIHMRDTIEAVKAEREKDKENQPPVTIRVKKTTTPSTLPNNVVPLKRARAATSSELFKDRDMENMSVQELRDAITAANSEKKRLLSELHPQ